MSGRFKKLFHRNKHDDDDDEFEYESRKSTDNAGRRSTSRRSVDVPSSPPLHSSPYNTASPGRSPQVGGSPLHGQSVPLSPPRTSKDRRSSDVPRSPVMRSERGQGLVAAATSSPAGTRQSRDTPRSGAPGVSASNNHTLELGPMDTNLSRDLQHLTLGGDNRFTTQPSRGQYDGDITRRPVPGGQPGQPAYGRDLPVIPSKDQYSEAVAERNLEQNRHVSPQTNAAPVAYSQQGEARGSPGVAPYADGVSSHPNGPREMSISRKPVDTTSSISSGPVAPASAPPMAPVDIPSQTASLNKPLPAAPPAEPVTVPPRVPVPDQNIQDPIYRLKDKQIAPQLARMIDLTNSEETDVHEKWAPAVTHETVHRQIHHVREERITREIHNHHIIHRVLPIIDVEVLPPRHLIPTHGGGFVEVAEEHIPGRTVADRARTNHAMRNWVIAELASKLPSSEPAHVGPRPFTARRFADGEGDPKRYVGPDGVERTEQWWVHPPTVDDGARLTGQTVPMHFYWTDDGRLETNRALVDGANGAGVGNMMDVNDPGIGARTVTVAGAAGAAGVKGRRRHRLRRSASSSSSSSSSPDRRGFMRA